MKIRGVLYWQGSNYDDNGHTDDYDLMFSSDDGKIQELCLNGLEDLVYVEMEIPPTIFDKISCTMNIELKDCEFVKNEAR
ncbi:MAG: hypothetical protein WC389_20555 [Lutibacter sp.]|jgi:hypothetical protein